MHCASIKRPLWLQGFSDIFFHNNAIFAKACLSGGEKNCPMQIVFAHVKEFDVR